MHAICRIDGAVNPGRQCKGFRPSGICLLSCRALNVSGIVSHSEAGRLESGKIRKLCYVCGLDSLYVWFLRHDAQLYSSDVGPFVRRREINNRWARFITIRIILVGGWS